MKKIIWSGILAALWLTALVARAQNEQKVPPTQTPYVNFLNGFKINGSYGSFGQCPISTGNAVQWLSCPGTGAPLPSLSPGYLFTNGSTLSWFALPTGSVTNLTSVSPTCGQIISATSVSGITINLPTLSALIGTCQISFQRGFFAGAVTVNPGSATYDGVSGTQQPPGSTIGIWTDGTSWHSSTPGLPYTAIAQDTPFNHGAVADGVAVSDVTTTATSCTVNSPSGGFSSAKAGQLIAIWGAGPNTWPGSSPAFTQTIQTVTSSTQITVNQDSSGHCPYQSVAPSSSMPKTLAIYGTDNGTAMNACAAATMAGGRCDTTVPQGKIMVYGSGMQLTSATAGLTPGGSFGGSGTLVFIPVQPLSFPSTEVAFWSTGTNRSACQQVTDSSLPAGSTTFHVSSSGEYSGAQAGDWLVMGFQPVSGLVEQTDWMQFSSASSTTVTLVQPTQTAFTPSGISYSSSCQGLSVYFLEPATIPTNILLHDFTLIVPNVQNGSGQIITSISTQFTRGFTEQNLTLIGEKGNASNFDQNKRMNNSETRENIQSEFTNSVDERLMSDTWNECPDQYSGYAARGPISGGPSFNYGVGRLHLAALRVLCPTNSAPVNLSSGPHNSSIDDVRIDWTTYNGASGGAGLVLTGGHDNHIGSVTCSGTNSTGTGPAPSCIYSANDFENSVCFPAYHNVVDQISGNFPNAYITAQCSGDIRSPLIVWGDDDTTGNKTLSSGLEVLGQGFYGSTANPVLTQLQLNGSASGGMQLEFNGTNQVHVIGSCYSSGDLCEVSNAYQTALTTDNWCASAASIGSVLVRHEYAAGTQVFYAAAGHACGTFAAFWGSAAQTFYNNGALGGSEYLVSGAIVIPSTTTGSAGGSSDVDVQMADNGTKTAQHYAAYKTSGGLTDGGFIPIEPSSTQTVGNLTCIKASGPPVVYGTCAVLSGVTCTTCN